MAPSRSGGPREFADAVEALAAARLPAAVELDDLPAPLGLAPFAHAVGGAVVAGLPLRPGVFGGAIGGAVGGGAPADEVDLSGGRFVLLHRPGGHDEWRGAYRCVVLVEADLEAEIAEDPLLAEVGWSWLMESLEVAGARFTAESGTVSRSSSLGFGGLSGRPATTAVEIRASWTPLPDPGGTGRVDFAAHLEAWCRLMVICAGLPPEQDGVTALPGATPAGVSR
jgi:hypothetical protein